MNPKYQTPRSERKPVQGGDYPRIRVSPPGPKAEAVIEMDREWASPSYIKEYPLVIGGGKGAMLEDVDGNRYIDWMSGIAVSATGYNHPKVVKAIQEQAGKYLHICGTDFYHEPMARLCQRLATLAPGGAREKWRVFLTNSGTEAVEGSVKLARYATGRSRIVAFDGAFHGRTYAALTLTQSKPKYKEGFGPFLPHVTHLNYDNPYRDIDGIRAAEEFLKDSPDQVAAVVMEPFQGEGGYIMPRREFLQAWRRICDEHGILLVFDEIQCGVGRTGKMWASDHFGVVPDILLTAKGLGSGMPIGAIVAKERVMTWKPGTHGTTFGGNPVCCAAALATLDLAERELCANADKMGKKLFQGLGKLQDRHPRIGDVRGTGLMIGVEFVKDRTTQEPDPDAVHALERIAFGKGLLLLSCGQSVIRVAPPLVLNEYDVEKGLELFDQSLRELKKL